MFKVHAGAVALRRVLVRRPWIYWVAIGLVAFTLGANVRGRMNMLESQRAAWGDAITVFVARYDVDVGEPLASALMASSVPVAIVPEAALRSVTDQVARRAIAAGSIVTEFDVASSSGPQSLAPAGHVIVALIESPSSGAAVGDAVQVASEGVVVSAHAIVVGHVGAATLVAVPAAEGPLLPAAAATGGIALLLIP